MVALADQMKAALRDKDGDRFAHTVRALYLHDPAAAKMILREGLRQAAGSEPRLKPPGR
ncbi:hypothetical protein F8568_043305 [Actinomadura sp. LD22]|uniref:Uncharacterized protein n=1 Tax=Actinomadura physcomitrii TaxID=2650748 RepID=A0A6I4MXF3_9ACTN|nr:hypothetical protein [Actinomadura physcomitrii]MWA07056.1 hypothetical protein [Actinomadura physcomitrii]